MGNPFGLSLQPLFKPEALALDVTPGNLRRWVSALKLNEVGETTRQLYEQLS